MTNDVRLPTMSVLGIGAVTPLGRDLGDVARALSSVGSADTPGRVPDELLADPVISKRMRRADRFSRMATIAAIDAWRAADRTSAGVPLDRVGLIVANGFGPHVRGFKFLDGILDHGDSSALPTDFSHSVHGAAAAYITELLGLRGPALNNTDFTAGVEHALLMAQCWLAEGRCDRVIVGAIEELGEVMEHMASKLLDDTERPTPLGEGTVFLTLGPASLSGIARIGVEPATSNDSSQSSMFLGAFGLSASSVAFELLGHLLTSRAGTAGQVDSPAMLRRSCDVRVTFTTEQQSPTSHSSRE